MGQRTPFYDLHVAAGARMVDFGGWDMPINYGSQIDEHHAVRQDAGMFDVSHMTIVEVEGPHAKAYLQKLLANDVAKLTQPGKALYSGMLNDHGGVIDDLIVYYLSDDHYRLVVNASTREKDLAWMNKQVASFDATVKHNTDFAMLAVQGPNAITKVQSIFNANQRAKTVDLGPFFAADAEGLFVARTGYTGEDGYEIMIPLSQVNRFWQALLEVGVRPAGLGARDTLRLEAGMNLYGNDMDETVSPLEANMGWTIAWEPADRDFVGRRALTEQKTAGVNNKFAGLVLQGKGVLRAGMKVYLGKEEIGVVTSGTMSPTLKLSIAMARIRKSETEIVQVDIRGKKVDAKVVKACFVRNGNPLI